MSIIEEIPADDDAKKYILKENIYKFPLWLTVQDYDTAVHASKIVRLFKLNKIVKNKEDINLIARYIDALKQSIFSPYDVEYLFIELTPYTCTISGANEFIIAPSHPELLMMNSKTFFNKKTITIENGLLGDFLDANVSDVLFTINLYEHGMIKRFHKNVIVMRHNYPEISDILLYFPKWTNN
jgi:hypothetical protein